MKEFELLPSMQTRMFDEQTEEGMRRTVPGMAHWSGTGPKGTTCRECLHYTYEGRYASNSKKHPAGGLKPGRCKKYQDLKKMKGKPFAHHKPSCRHFEPHPNPPIAVEQKYGHYGYR